MSARRKRLDVNSSSHETGVFGEVKSGHDWRRQHEIWRLFGHKATLQMFTLSVLECPDCLTMAGLCMTSGSAVFKWVLRAVASPRLAAKYTQLARGLPSPRDAANTARLACSVRC